MSLIQTRAGGFTFLYEWHGYTSGPRFAILIVDEAICVDLYPATGFARFSGFVPAQDAAQTAPTKSRYVSTIGEVVSVDAAAKQVKVKTDKGEEVSIPLQDQTSYLRMPPGEKALTKATRIELKDINVGDRVLARTLQGEGGAMGPAGSIILMTKADLAEFHEKSRAEWEKRGTVGTVASLDPATKIDHHYSGCRIDAQGHEEHGCDTGQEGGLPALRAGSGSSRMRKPSTFAEIKVGDRIRVLGDKNEDSTNIKAEEDRYRYIPDFGGDDHIHRSCY